MGKVTTIAPCLWFDDQAEEAASFYTEVFPNSKIESIARYGKAGFEIHGRPEGSVMTVSFLLDGQPFTALNGGPAFTFNEAISLQVMCDDQAEADRYWEQLGSGGDPAAQQCGWLKDRFGVSWQIVPKRVIELLESPDPHVADRAMAAVLEMKRIDIAEVERAASGG